MVRPSVIFQEYSVTKNPIVSVAAPQASNGDTDRSFQLTDGSDTVEGIGSFHKSLPHNKYGEVSSAAFAALKQAAVSGNFQAVPPDISTGVAALTNPLAGLAEDRLTSSPSSYVIPPAPQVLSDATAAEMTELYWMAMLRDVPFNEFATHAHVQVAVGDINAAFARAVDATGADASKLRVGIDVPGAPSATAATAIFTPHNLFRMGMPGEEVGPMVSQFFVRPIGFGTQTIDARQRPYKAGKQHDYLTDFPAWLKAQDSGRDMHGQAYSSANEDGPDHFEDHPRYISTMRDLARFVNKDALHQAYFNAALLMLSGGAKWTPGNPYAANNTRDTGFGVLGGPHILALVSEVATRALKIVWHQKWQVHLRLRPEAYGGLAHVQKKGIPSGNTRAYGLPEWLFDTQAAKRIAGEYDGGYLLPMAYTPGSPTHPAYGAGHATVAGACVTVLKAYFQLLETVNGQQVPIPLVRLVDGDLPYGTKPPMKAYLTGLRNQNWERIDLGSFETKQLTIEGELNKLAQNVAMGRSMGGVHWRTDNARSLALGEAIAARILCDIAQDAHEHPSFAFRTFARSGGGQPRTVEISKDGIQVDGKVLTGDVSAL